MPTSKDNARGVTFRRVVRRMAKKKAPRPERAGETLVDWDDPEAGASVVDWKARGRSYG
ncbi:MAG: hypothetical protein IT183_02790, partial [Acidobacteria bacterium]|nr:hypothetical protein [Acidobacteriota bacterium]